MGQEPVYEADRDGGEEQEERHETFVGERRKRRAFQEEAYDVACHHGAEHGHAHRNGRVEDDGVDEVAV